MTAPVTQAQLHQVIEALYSKQLRLDMQSAEAILRTAHYLDLSCVQASAELFIARHFIPIAPVEVGIIGLLLRSTAHLMRLWPIMCQTRGQVWHAIVPHVAVCHCCARTPHLSSQIPAPSL